MFNLPLAASERFKEGLKISSMCGILNTSHNTGAVL